MLKQTEKPYYAVGVGKKPGIYRTWKECESQTEGVKSPKFRKFSTLVEAEEFVNKWANDYQCDNDGLKEKTLPKTKYLGADQLHTRALFDEVMISGHNSFNIKVLKEKIISCEKKIDKCFNDINGVVSLLAGIKADLRNALDSISDISGSASPVNRQASRYPNFTNYSSAKSRNMSDSSETNMSEEIVIDSDVEEVLDEFCESERKAMQEGNYNIQKKLTTHKSANWNTPSNEDDDDSVPKKKKKNDNSDFIVEDGFVIVYTDGSCFQNGMKSAKAGIGIWFGDNHPLNVSKPVSGKPSNNNAEIQAARIAMELALKSGIKKLKIRTDSEFLINCAVNWMKRWKKNGWVTSTKLPVKNRKELEKLDKVMNKLIVRWEKVLAHSGLKGNEEADRLANAGAAEYGEGNFDDDST